MTAYKPMAIGVEDYREIIRKAYYYIDKTLLVKELLDKGGKVNLFIRPRRFGKTLALSMLKTFFEADVNEKGNLTDSRHYFAGMKILQAGEKYTEQMGKYPVISLSLKSAKQPNYEMAYASLINQISKEYERHRYVLNGAALLPANADRFRRIMERRAEAIDYATALEFLSACLKAYHNRNVIILIDEYDVPLENTYFEGFYEQMMQFIHSLFESALKTNDNLEFAVITGCLRISKESIFTGLNNLKVISVLNNDYAEYFGFIESEVYKMLQDYGMEQKGEEAKEWYDGYLFGRTEVYNPWSIINYVDAVLSDRNAFPKPYWSNTSSNSIVRELVENADAEVKRELEELIAGGTIEKPVHEEITYGDIHSSQDNLWNFLFFTGYLKAEKQRLEQETIYLTMRIPNAEVLYIYRHTIREWFSQRVKMADFRPFYEAVLTGDSEKMADFISHQLMGSISYYDNAESFYHGYLVGTFSGLEGYELISNKEAGDSRPDIVLSPFTPKQPAIIIEIKVAKKFPQMDALCDDALRQIEEKNYAAELEAEGYQKIIKYGICFCRKTCSVKHM